MQAPLERGKACSTCRSRKMRCDGQHPSCSQCIRSGRGDECEYLDASGPTLNQTLEAQIERIEGRIAEIMASSAPPLTLHDPYAGWRQAQRQAHNETVRSLLRDFLLHASEFGFFMHVPRFFDKVHSQATRNRGLVILLNVVFLIGAKLSHNPQIQAQENDYRTRALQNLPTAVPEDPQWAMYVMQAEVLLANYFFNENRQLEGMYHTNAAVSIAMACKLHLIRSTRRSRSSATNNYRLPNPADTLEEGERINGFWTVFILERCWATASGSGPAFTDDEAHGTQVDTPWPMDLATYQSHPFPGDFRTSHTVQAFVAGTPQNTASSGQSVLAMQAKAAILYEMATRLASRYNPSSQGNFLSLDNRIEHFRRSLSRIDPSRTDTVRTVLLTHTLAQYASIQLHTPLVQDRVTANSRTYEAAHAAVENLRSVSPPGFVNPLMAILWGSVAKVLSQATATSRRLRTAGASTGQHIPADEHTLRREFDRVMAAMEASAGVSPLMSTQLASFRPPRQS